MSFLDGHLGEAVLVLVVLCVFAGMALYVIWRYKRIEELGKETEGVVSRVERNEDSDGDVTYQVYADYRDDTGGARESFAGSFSTRKYQEGDRVRIKFVPGEYDWVKILKDKKES